MNDQKNQENKRTMSIITGNFLNCLLGEKHLI